MSIYSGQSGSSKGRHGKGSSKGSKHHKRKHKTRKPRSPQFQPSMEGVQETASYSEVNSYLKNKSCSPNFFHLTCPKGSGRDRTSNISPRCRRIKFDSMFSQWRLHCRQGYAISIQIKPKFPRNIRCFYSNFTYVFLMS